MKPIEFSYHEIGNLFTKKSPNLHDGSNSIVVVGNWKGDTVAVKQYYYSEPTEKMWKAEIAFLSEYQHPHVISLIGQGVNLETPEKEPTSLKDDPRRYFLVYPYAGRSLKNKFRVRALTQAAQAIKYIHDNGIVHGDLKLDNILVDELEHVRLADFGSSVSVGQESLTVPEDYPPEFATKGKATKELDIYTYGMMILRILINDKLSGDDLKVKARIGGENVIRSKLYRTGATTGVSMLFKLAQDCTNPVVGRRPTIEDIIKQLQQIAAER